jgi:hypothetical protein
VKAYLKEVFSAEGCASFARYLTAVTAAVCLTLLVYATLERHDLPEASKMLALGTIIGGPYALNKIAGAISNSNASPTLESPAPASKVVAGFASCYAEGEREGEQ